MNMVTEESWEESYHSDARNFNSKAKLAYQIHGLLCEIQLTYY